MIVLFLKKRYYTGEKYGADIYWFEMTGDERTPVEWGKEFYGIYFNEYYSIKNGKGTELVKLPDYLEDEPTFDQKA